MQTKRFKKALSTLLATVMFASMVTVPVFAAPPALSVGSTTRTDATTAEVKFTSGEAGSGVYAVSVTPLVSYEAIDALGNKVTISAITADSKNTLSITGLTSGTGANVYIAAKNSSDEKSTVLTVAIPAVPADVTAPTLTAGGVTRTAEATATVKFTSNEAGNYYYKTVEVGAEKPTIVTSASGVSCDKTEQTISVTGMTGITAKDIYIVVKDASNNVSSNTFKIAIPAYSAPDSTAPTLSAGIVTRATVATATVKFTSNETGSGVYAVSATPHANYTAVDGAVGKQSIASVSADENNTLSVTGLTTGAKDIYIAVKDAANNESTVLKITIPAEGALPAVTYKISGTVNDNAVPAIPVANATVELLDNNGASFTPEKKAITGADGKYEFTGVAAATYQVKVTEGGYTDKTETGVVVLASNVTKDITLPVNKYNVSGMVYSTGTTPVADGTKVGLYKASTQVGGDETTALSNGKFTFANVPYGTYTIRATTGDGKKSTSIVVDVHGTVMTANLTLPEKNETVKAPTVAGELAGAGIAKVESEIPAIGNNQNDYVGLTDAQKTAIANGNTITTQINVGTTTKTQADTEIKNALAASNLAFDVAITPVFFTIDLEVAVGGTASNITDLGNNKVKLVLDVPTAFRGQTGYKLYNFHNGRVIPLVDLDSTLDTYTAEISKFSVFSFAKATAVSIPPYRPGTVPSMPSYPTYGGGYGGGWYGATPVNTYAVSYNTLAGRSVATTYVNTGSMLTLPTAPTRDGYVFSGWYFDAACTKQVPGEYRPTGAVTLYAFWQSNTPVVAPTNPTAPTTSTTVPQTGDASAIPFVALLFVAAAAIVVIMAPKKKFDTK